MEKNETKLAISMFTTITRSKEKSSILPESGTHRKWNKKKIIVNAVF